MHQDGEWEELGTYHGAKSPLGLPRHRWCLPTAWKRGWGLQPTSALGQACSRAWGDPGGGKSPLCHGRAKGFIAETAGEENVRSLLASSAAGGRAPGAPSIPDPPGVAWQGGDAGTLGQQRLAEGLAEPITPRAALPRRREPQITARQAEPGSAPGLAWADTGPKGRPRARLSPADRPPAPLHPTLPPHALDKQLASLRPWRSPRRAFPRLSHRFGGSLGGKTPP